MNFIQWCNDNNGFLTAILSLIGLILSVTAIVVSIRTARLPYKKRIMLGSSLLLGTSVVPGVSVESSILGMSASATNVGNRTAQKNILYQNTPNPAKEQTIIRYQLADNTKDAAICIFDMQGKMLKKLPVSSDNDSVTINGYELGQGMFLYSLVVNGQEIDTKKMIITK
jgi:hypothetical protein